MEELERAYTVPLGEAYEKPRVKRAKIASKILRSFVSRHMKVGEDSVKISTFVNSAIWESGMKKPPRKLKIVANRDKEGIVRVTLSSEKEELAKLSEKARKKEERKAKPSAKKEEKKPGEKKPEANKPENEGPKASDAKK